MNILLDESLVLLVSTLLLGLIAGLFYGYSCSVNMGLGRLTDVEYLKAMQSINRAILNAWFFIIFMGPLLILPVSIWISYERPNDTRFYVVSAAAVIYYTAVFGVTIRGNVPLNEALDTFHIESASGPEITERRSLFEDRWNRLHSVRTLASVGCFLLMVIACFL